jgi:molybdate transport repressor ModE-like protein
VEVRELRAFVAVAEEGSLSAAARRLHVSQSALSQTVQSMERQLGVQLLLRSSTGVTATEAGATLLREARALIAQHDRLLAAVAGEGAAAPGTLRVGIPVELPADLLPGVLAGLSATCPLTRAEVSHAASAAQLAALAAGQLDVALVRARPADPDYDAVLAVEEALGVILAAERADELAGPAGLRLHQLAGLDWVGFPRSDAPLWYDQVTATLRAHGIALDHQPPAGEHPLLAEVKFAAVGAGRAFALAPPDLARQPPEGVAWQPLIGNPLIRRTWAVWPASSRRRDVAALVAALDLTTR